MAHRIEDVVRHGLAEGTCSRSNNLDCRYNSRPAAANSPRASVVRVKSGRAAKVLIVGRHCLYVGGMQALGVQLE